MECNPVDTPLWWPNIPQTTSYGARVKYTISALLLRFVWKWQNQIAFVKSSLNYIPIVITKISSVLSFQLTSFHQNLLDLLNCGAPIRYVCVSKYSDGVIKGSAAARSHHPNHKTGLGSEDCNLMPVVSLAAAKQCWCPHIVNHFQNLAVTQNIFLYLALLLSGILLRYFDML